MAEGGRAWRGWFPVGGELTSGLPDRKEGIYFGAELDRERPAGAGRDAAPRPQPLPAEAPELRDAVLDLPRRHDRARPRRARGAWRSRSASSRAGSTTTSPPTRSSCSASSTTRPSAGAADPNWGVGEHTDYGLLTILGQDDHGGLEVHAPTGWIDGAADPGHVRVQPRRHARADDRRPLPVDARTGCATAATPIGSRSRSSSTRAGTPRCCPVPLDGEGADRARGAVGRRGRVRLRRHLRRVPARQGGPGLPRPQGVRPRPVSSRPLAPRSAGFLVAEALSAIGSWATIVAIWGYAAYEYDATAGEVSLFGVAFTLPGVAARPARGHGHRPDRAEGHARAGQGHRRRRVAGPARRRRLPRRSPCSAPSTASPSTFSHPALQSMPPAPRRRGAPGPHQRPRVAHRRAGHRARPGGRRRRHRRVRLPGRVRVRRRHLRPRPGRAARWCGCAPVAGGAPTPSDRARAVPRRARGVAAHRPHRRAAPHRDLHLRRPPALRHRPAGRAALRARHAGAVAERLRRPPDRVRHLPGLGRPARRPARRAVGVASAGWRSASAPRASPRSSTSARRSSRWRSSASPSGASPPRSSPGRPARCCSARARSAPTAGCSPPTSSPAAAPSWSASRRRGARRRLRRAVVDPRPRPRGRHHRPAPLRSQRA